MKGSFKRFITACVLLPAVSLMSFGCMTFGAEGAEIVVDRSISASDPSANIYKTVQEAVAAAPDGTEDSPTVIRIKPGVYLMNGDDKVNGLVINKNYLTIIGDSDNAEDVVLADNRGNNQGASGNANSASVMSNCTGLTMKNISIYNYCNMDVPFEKDPSQALKRRSDVETQAFAYIGMGDKHIYENCHFMSILDTMSCDARSYFKNCYVQGTNDFMGGSGEQYWEDSTINSLSNHIVGGGNKVVFNKCTFLLNKTSDSRPTYFCKGWTTITVMNSVIPTQKGAYQWTPSLPGQFMFRSYNNKNDDGAPAEIIDNTCGYELTAEQAEAFNPYNILRGNDGWDPAGAKAQYEAKGFMPMYVNVNDAVTVRTGNDPVTINASVYPAGADQSVSFSAEGDISIAPNGNSCVITAENNSLNVTTAVVTATASNGVKNKTVVTVQPGILPAPVFTVQPKFITDEGGSEQESRYTIADAEAALRAVLDSDESLIGQYDESADGVLDSQDVAEILQCVLDPSYGGEAPGQSKGSLSIDYALDLGSASNDTSLISWYRCDDAQGSNPLIMADSKRDIPTKTYTFSKGDIGKYIMVTIVPKSELSDPGEAVSLVYPDVITADMVNNNLSTNFLSVVTHPPFITEETLGTAIDNGDGTTTPYRNTLLNSIKGTVPGRWNFIGNWWYNNGSGTYADNAVGVITGTRYGRAIYPQPTADYGDMTAVARFTPEKNAGQGFGSAGQYQELLIKYDPDTQTGCGIRYTRSSALSNGVDFQLYEYKDGEGTPIGDIKTMDSTFRSNCVITLSLKGTQLSAKIETDYSSTSDDGTVTTVEPVELTGTITNTTGFGGFEIYHQGSTGGRFVFTGVDLIYE